MAYKVFVVAGDNKVLQDLPAIIGDAANVSLLESSNEALWELQQVAPDVLIADLDLPGFSGLDLAELVPDFAPETRVVVCAREVIGDREQQAAKAGLFRLVSGEIDPGALRAVVIEALNAPPPERAPEPVREPEPEPTPPPPPEPRKATPKPAAPRPAEQRPPSRPIASPPTSGISKTPFAVSKAPPPAPIRKAPPRVSARPEALPPRTTQAAAPTPTRERPAPPPEPTPPPVQQEVVSDTKRRQSSGGALVLTAESVAPIRAKLKDLGIQLGAQATVLTDRWGVPLVEEGQTTLPLPPFLPLLATSFSTLIDYTSQLHADGGSGLYMHEGNRYDIYIFDVGRQFLLVMIFNKDMAVSKLGSVWVYAKRAVRELADILEGT